MGGGTLWASSAVSRAKTLLPMAESLEDGIDTLGRIGLTAKDAPRAESYIAALGKRFSDEVPEKSGDAYALVAEKLPGDVARLVTGYLLKGVGRRGFSS